MSTGRLVTSLPLRRAAASLRRRGASESTVATVLVDLPAGLSPHQIAAQADDARFPVSHRRGWLRLAGTVVTFFAYATLIHTLSHYVGWSEPIRIGGLPIAVLGLVSATATHGSIALADHRLPRNLRQPPGRSRPFTRR